MPRTLKQVDPTRPPGIIVRTYSAIAATRFARFVSRRVSWKLDPFLLRLTGGRVATTLVFPTTLLETTGARTGTRRRHAVIYFNDGERVVIIASNAGAASHPAWFHNLCAHPDVILGGAPMRAAVVADEEDQARLWLLADHVFPAFADYRRDAAKLARTIPIMQLTARGNGPAAEPA